MGLVYSSFLGYEWLSKAHTAPSQVQLPWPPSPLQLGHQKPALGLSLVHWAMNYSGLIWLESG